MAAGSKVLKLLNVTRLPIFNQLCLEEALLRNTRSNWLLLNDGAFFPAIVMGISGKASELVHVPEAAAAGVQLIKRFTGGGTVVVDHDTVFVTLIMEGSSLPDVEPYPQPVMRWTESFYDSVFRPYGGFKLRENDYVYGDRKFGGNAQAITGKRWLHHTSLLWDYDPANMALLKHPSKAPEYREGRRHDEFIMRLREVIPSRLDVLEGVVRAAHEAGFELQEASLEEAAAHMFGTPAPAPGLAPSPGRPLCGTKLLNLQELLQGQHQQQ